MPILKSFLNSRKRYIALLFFLALIGLGFEMINIVYQSTFQESIIQSFRLWTWYFYYILGGFIALMSTEDLQKFNYKSLKFTILSLFLASPIYLFTVAKNIHHNFYAEFLYDTLLVKFISLGIFLVFLQADIKVGWRKLIATLSSLIMGVFIIHPYVMKIWEKTVGLDFEWSYIVYFVAVLSLSFIGVALIAKLPYLNKIIKL